MASQIALKSLRKRCNITTFPRFLVHLLSIVSISLFPLQGSAGSLAKPGCQEKCKNITIPYPFGIGTGCYLDKPFELICNESLPFSPLHFASSRPILDISLHYVQVYGEALVSYNISSSWGIESTLNYDLESHFSFSHTRNKFIVTGCNVVAFATDYQSTNQTVACASFCDNITTYDTTDFSACYGFGCCQATVPRGLRRLSLTKFDRFIDYLNQGAHSSFACSSASIVDKDFSGYNGCFGHVLHRVPMVLNWKIENVTCIEARERGTYVCGKNSKCTDLTDDLGYQCRCLTGHQGNPYLPSGCQDLNDCPLGYGCKRRRHSLAEIVYIGVGIVILISIAIWLYLKFEKRRKTEIKQKYFKRNGGLLMQQQISSNKGSVMKTKLFSIEDLKKATNNFNQSRVLGKGGHGTVYKGVLPDRSIVAVKTSNIVHEHQVNRFINEVLILSQINQRNIVKLLGCCLESEVPLIVYEYVSNGTLSQHLHDEKLPTISWENRLRIAWEVAGALAYLHSYASTAIFHRDIKSTNILLDENYGAVVSDFGLSRSISLSKTHLTTLVGGTFGYLDPDYFRSGQFTDKSDVYSFGVVLIELLTGQSVVSSNSSDEGLAIHFRSAMKQNLLFDIINTPTVNEVQKNEILVVAKIAKSCLKSKPKKRPSMMEVAADLNKLIQEQHLNTISHYVN